MDYLSTHNLISKHQHAFLKKHSTTTNLLESLHDWSLSLTNNNSVTIAYIDFCCAFDSISHSKLLHKILKYGIKGNLHSWINAFLSNRTQVVKVGSNFSSSIPVISGVPQGSVLGPLLFLLFINDIANNMNLGIKIKLFADDVKLYTEISLPSDHSNFQSQLNNIHSWASIWQIKISYEKSNILNLNTKIHPSFYFTDIPILPVDSMRDLGILVQADLKFNTHIHNIIAKAKQRASLIHRSFLSKDVQSLSRAFVTYVRPTLEYASAAWSPSSLTLIHEIESVQRSFTKRIPGLHNFSYVERLKLLKLKSLEHRRLIADLVTCYNIIHNKIEITNDHILELSNTTQLRGNPFKLKHPKIKNNIQKHFFSNRIINSWNSLPITIVTAANVNIFKKLICQHNLSNYLTEPTYLL